MKITKTMVLASLMIVTSGCYQKYLVLRAEAVSMTEANAGSSKNLKMGDEIEEKWCVGDAPVLETGDKVYGLADQVIYKAQNKGRAADFITDVKVYRDSNGCALLSGRLAKK